MADEQPARSESHKWDYVGRELFSIGQACAACGLSRSMLIKLENAGFLRPCKIDSHTGYRYYDMFDISRLQQYQTLRLLGLSTSEVMDYYGNDERHKQTILANMRERLQTLERSVEELSVRLERREELTFSLLDLPDLTCYCQTVTCTQPLDAERHAFEAHTETVRRGWRMLPGESIFTIRTGADPLVTPYEVKICIPLDPQSLGRGPRGDVELIPGGRALSVLYYGSYEQSRSLIDVIAQLMAEVERRGLTPAGAVRSVGVVAPYVGREFAEKDSVFRFAVPV